MVQVYFQNKWVDLVDGKFSYDKDKMLHEELQLDNAVEAYNLARKRATNYAHRIIQVNVVRFNNGKDS
jgi:hypothetical protein